MTFAFIYLIIGFGISYHIHKNGFLIAERYYNISLLMIVLFWLPMAVIYLIKK